MNKIKTYTSKYGNKWSYLENSPLPSEVVSAMKNGDDLPIKYQNRKVSIDDVKKALLEKGYSEKQIDNQLSQNIPKEDLIEVFQQITPSFWITKVGELMKGIRATRWGYFLTEPIYFSDGWREIYQDLLPVNVYENVKDNRYPTDSIYPDDKEVKFFHRLRLIIRNDFNEATRIPYFPNGEAYTRWINQQMSRTIQTMVVAHELIIEMIFGEGVPTKIFEPKALPYILKMVNNIKLGFKNIVDIKDETEEIVKVLLNDSENATLIATPENTIGKVDKPFHLQPTLENLVIIYNYKLPIKFLTDVKASLFNPYDWPKISKLKLKYMPIGKIILMDKEVIKLAPNMMKYVVSPLFVTTLDQLTGTHVWTFYGINENRFGIVYNTSSYKSANDLMNKFISVKKESTKTWEDLSKLTGNISDYTQLGLENFTLTEDEIKHTKINVVKVDNENKQLTINVNIDYNDNKFSNDFIITPKSEELI